MKETPFKDIWEKSQIFQELRDFKKYKGKCGDCEYLNVCGGCRARADAVYGDYLEEEPFCNYTPGQDAEGKGGEDTVKRPYFSIFSLRRVLVPKITP